MKWGQQVLNQVKVGRFNSIICSGEHFCQKYYQILAIRQTSLMDNIQLENSKVIKGTNL